MDEFLMVESANRLTFCEVLGLSWLDAACSGLAH